MLSQVFLGAPPPSLRWRNPRTIQVNFYKVGMAVSLFWYRNNPRSKFKPNWNLLIDSSDSTEYRLDWQSARLNTMRQVTNELPSRMSRLKVYPLVINLVIIQSWEELGNGVWGKGVVCFQSWARNHLAIQLTKDSLAVYYTLDLP